MLLDYFPVRGFNDEPFTDAWRSGRAGTPLADGWRAAYYGHRADLQCFAAMFYYKNYNMNECCCFCNADKTDPDLDPSNLLPDAPWIDTCITHDEYMRDARKLSPLTSIPGWHLWSNFWDCMHGVHLGPGVSMWQLIAYRNWHRQCLEASLLRFRLCTLTALKFGSKRTS